MSVTLYHITGLQKASICRSRGFTDESHLINIEGEDRPKTIEGVKFTTEPFYAGKFFKRLRTVPRDDRAMIRIELPADQLSACKNFTSMLKDYSIEVWYVPAVIANRYILPPVPGEDVEDPNNLPMFEDDYDED